MPQSLRQGTSYLSFWLFLAILIGLPHILWARDFMPHPFEIDARAAVLMDANSGDFVYGQNPKTRIKPASFVKILTLFLIFDAVKNGQVRLEDNVLISKKAWRTRGSKMFIRPGSQVPLVELFKGIAVVSGNDACVASAEFLQGSEKSFVKKMNEKLADLGINDTQIRTVSGWPAPDQYTTAFDMALLARAYIQEHPEVLRYHRLKEFTSEGVRQRNRNGLLWRDTSVDGLKTGYTKKAGYHLLATAKREEQRFIAVVMDAENPKVREREALRLLNYGFRNYVSVPLFEKGQLLLALPVWKGQSNRVGLAAAESGVVTVPISQKTQVSWQTETPEKLLAPVQGGKHLGKAVITVKDEVIKSVALVSEREVPQGGLLKTTAHSLALLVTAHKKSLISALLLILLTTFLVWYRRQRRQNRRKRRRYLPA
jgi:D-alanyl-D-alanine carboxypeptidase (penicillin-binding protein 5/6)